MTIEEFTSTFYSLRSKVEAYANRLLQKQVEAEDVSQDVMLKIWQSGVDLNEINNPEAYCIQMTKHLSLDRLKAKNYQWNTLTDDLNQSSDLDHPEKYLERKDFSRILEEAIANLPSIQKKIFEYREFEQMTYEEIASKENMSLSNVKIQLHRSRTRLRTLLINTSQGEYNYEKRSS